MFVSFLSGAALAFLLSVHPDRDGISEPLHTGQGIFYGISINTDQVMTRGPPMGTNILSAAIVGSLSGVAVALRQPSLRCALASSRGLSGVARGGGCPNCQIFWPRKVVVAE